MHSNHFFKIVDGKVIDIDPPSWIKTPPSSSKTPEKSTLVYTKFPNIVEDGDINLPSDFKTVEELHNFISILKSEPINKSSVDYFFRKLEGVLWKN